MVAKAAKAMMTNKIREKLVEEFTRWLLPVGFTLGGRRRNVIGSASETPIFSAPQDDHNQKQNANPACAIIAGSRKYAEFCGSVVNHGKMRF
jgi:hypothetical protein